MKDSTQVLQTECEIFTRCLLGAPPPGYVVQKYLDAHDHAEQLESSGGFDALLVRIARTHPFLTAFVDSYARLALPQGTIRQKLVVLLALLETTTPTATSIEDVAGTGKLALVAQLTWRVSLAVVRAMIGLMVFTPLRLIASAKGRNT